MNKVLCEGNCGRAGHYKSGLCLQCRPRCPHCKKTMNGPRGQRVHIQCAKRVRVSEVEDGSRWNDVQEVMENPVAEP